MHFANAGIPKRDVVTALLKTASLLPNPLLYLSSEWALQLEVPKIATRVCCGEGQPLSISPLPFYPRLPHLPD